MSNQNCNNCKETQYCSSTANSCKNIPDRWTEDFYKRIPSEDFMKITTQEYFFWVIITEWDLGYLWDLPNEEFSIKDGDILIPGPLRKYMNNESVIKKL